MQHQVRFQAKSGGISMDHRQLLYAIMQMSQ